MSFPKGINLFLMMICLFLIAPIGYIIAMESELMFYIGVSLYVLNMIGFIKLFKMLIGY